MNIEPLLSRVQKLKSTGKNRWLCACPSHTDKSPSLAISITDDGKVLINCFAGCDPYSILQSVGLDWDAVFPEKAISHREKPLKQVLYPSEALELMHYECLIVLVSAYSMQKGTLNQNDLERLEVSMQRISKAKWQAGL